MKTRSLFLLSVTVVAFFIAASQFTAAHAGPGTVLPANRLPIEQLKDSGQWKTTDITVE